MRINLLFFWGILICGHAIGQRYIVPDRAKYINVLLSDTVMGYGYLAVVTVQDPSGTKRETIEEAQTICTYLCKKNSWTLSQYHQNARKYFDGTPIQVGWNDIQGYSRFFDHFIDESPCSIYHDVPRDSLISNFRKAHKDLDQAEFRCLVKQLIKQNVLIAESETVIGLALPMD